MALLLLRVPYASAAHMDLARDMFVAWRLLRGEAFPLEGPILAGTIHLGPVWYYLLAALQALGRSWYGTLLLLALLASLQIPLAYLLGKELHSRRAGMLWAVGLIVPTWTVYDWMLPVHPILSPLLVLAFLLCCLRYWRGGERRYFFAMAFGFCLALHAHPSNAGLAFVGLFVLLRAPHQRLRWYDFGIAALLALLPLLPFFAADAMQGFADLRKSGAYLADPNATGSPLQLPILFAATVYGGTRYLFEPMSGWDSGSAGIATALVMLGGIAGAIGLLRGWRDPDQRPLLQVALAATLVIMLTAATIRGVITYYMIASSHVMLAGLVGIGLCQLGEWPLARAVRACAVVAALAACLATSYGNARFQIRGAWPFAWMPMFDVRQPAEAPTPLLLMPTYAVADSGQFLCAQARPSIHGTYGSQLIHNYAMDMRLACGRSDVHIGGNESDRSHWLGMSRALFAQSGVRPIQRLGPIGITRATPISTGRPLLEPATPQYPAYFADNQAPSPHHLTMTMRASDHLAISNLAFAFSFAPKVSVRIDGQPVASLAHDWVTAVYACSGCAAGVTANAEIDVESGDFVDVDVVLF